MMQKDPRQKHRCNCNSIELRKTHYTLGRDYCDPITQYRHDYPPKQIPNLGKDKDTNNLRASHFKLGDDINPYLTTSAVQNKDIENAGRCNPSLDENAKNDLRRSHFALGNNKPDFETTFRAEYYDKSGMLPPPGNMADIEKMLRSHNYEFGDDKPDYISEAKFRYQKPVVGPLDKQKNLSTADLQKNHYVFGNSTEPWNTTQKRSYTPKMADNQRETKDLTRTNFILGDDASPLQSINNQIYVEHPYQYKPVDPKYLEDLRSHHYQFGKYPSDPLTQYRVDYQDPGLSGDNFKPTMDNQMLRKAHFILGDALPEDLYNTTYNVVHTPKKVENDKNIIRPSTLNLGGKNPMTYLTDYRDNYIPLGSEMPNKNKINDMIHTIKDSHFKFGDTPNDFSTTSGNAYQYDPNKARDAKGGLNTGLLNDLRNTHYKLGYDNDVGISTQKKDFIPYGAFENERLKGLYGNNFNLGDNYNNKFEGQTIYSTDYIKKEIPDNGNDCWC